MRINKSKLEVSAIDEWLRSSTCEIAPFSPQAAELLPLFGGTL